MVKKLKPGPVDVRRLLRTQTVAQLVDRCDRTAGFFDDLLDILDDVDRWGDGDVEVKVVEVLCAAGESEEIVWEVMRLIEDLDDDDDPMVDDESWVLSRVVFAVGKHAEPATARLILDRLDTVLVDDGRPPPGWHHLLELVVRCAERGHHDERTWSWLERLRASDPALWASLSAHDPRSIPLLQGACDDAAAALDSGDVEAADFIIEAVAALTTQQQARDIDRERLTRAQAIRVAHGQRAG